MELITAQKFALKFKLNLQPLKDLKVRGTARPNPAATEPMGTQPQKGIPREIVQKNTTSSFCVKTSSLFYFYSTPSICTQTRTTIATKCQRLIT